MNAAEAIINGRKDTEIEILSCYVQRMGAMVCSRVAWHEYESAPDGCECPACCARECLATVAMTYEVYHSSMGGLDIRSFGQA